jgi:hypothetical protein
MHRRFVLERQELGVVVRTVLKSILKESHVMDYAGPVLVWLEDSCMRGNESMSLIKFGLFFMELIRQGYILTVKTFV